VCSTASRLRDHPKRFSRTLRGEAPAGRAPVCCSSRQLVFGPTSSARERLAPGVQGSASTTHAPRARQHGRRSQEPPLRRSQARSSFTRPSGRTCSIAARAQQTTSHALAAAPRRSELAPGSNGRSMRWPEPLHTSQTGAWTSSRRASSATRSTPGCTRTRAAAWNSTRFAFLDPRAGARPQAVLPSAQIATEHRQRRGHVKAASVPDLIRRHLSGRRPGRHAGDASTTWI
jgi:hypothetical protein